MAISTSCCLNFCPLPSSSPSQPSRTNQVTFTWSKNEKRSLKNQCIVGIACVIMGLEMGNSLSGDCCARAEDLKMVVDSKAKIERWSDKRVCPPWLMNSLETIVPENLPRPSARRRWEAVGHHPSVAPTVKYTVGAKPSCFTM